RWIISLPERSAVVGALTVDLNRAHKHKAFDPRFAGLNSQVQSAINIDTLKLRNRIQRRIFHDMSASSAVNYGINTVERLSPAGRLIQFQTGNYPACFMIGDPLRADHCHNVV